MKDRISITMLEGGIADVRLIRADKMNALDPAMWEALAEAVDQLKATAGLRVVVLSGEGRAFCAGLDLSSLSNDRDPGASSAGGTLSDRTRGIVNNAQYAAWGWREIPVPVIAAVVEDAGEMEPEEVDAGVEAVAVVEDDPPPEEDAGRKAVRPVFAKKGKLSVITMLKGEPYWAQVLIDGVSKGRTPLLLDLPAGRYVVKVERPGFKSQTREIRVASGKAAVVRIDLTQ
jgi:hypothetical protein